MSLKTEKQGKLQQQGGKGNLHYGGSMASGKQTASRGKVAAYGNKTK